MRRLIASATALLIALSVPAYAPGQSKTPALVVTPIELRISGPRLIHLGDRLKFTATLTNRSDKPLALRFPFFFTDETQFNWRITNAGGRILPPHIYDGPPIYVCPVTGPLTDSMITVLQPGEKMDYDYLGDPSDDFAFTGKGFYRVTLTYILAPISPDAVRVDPYRSQNEPPEKYTPEQKIEMLKNMPRIEVSSNEWHMYLTD